MKGGVEGREREGVGRGGEGPREAGVSPVEESPMRAESWGYSNRGTSVR